MEEFWPAIGFIIYLVLQMLGVFGGKKNEENLPEDSQPEQSQGKSIFRELRRQFEEIEGEIKKMELPKPAPSAEREPSPEETYKSPGQEYKSMADDMELTQYEPISAEVLKSPYSNLEEGILDDIHRSKFAHHSGDVNMPPEVYHEKKINLFENISPKDAFVYSLIFDRKYFKL